MLGWKLHMLVKEAPEGEESEHLTHALVGSNTECSGIILSYVIRI